MSQSARPAVSAVLLFFVAAWSLALVRTPDLSAAGAEVAGAVAAADMPISVVLAAPTPSPTSVPQAPSIAYFTCDPCVVEPGGGATLSWDLSGATAAYLDDEGITAPGSKVVYPDQTSTYRLVAVNDAGRSEKTVTVEVRGLPTIHYFTCLPCEVTKGEQSTLSWDLSGATAAYMNGVGVTAPGSTLVAPGQTTTYRLVAVGERGSVERLVTVTVKEGGDPETVVKTLRAPGYDVRWVGLLPLEQGGDTISVVMKSAVGDLHSQEVADQYYAGFRALYDNYPNQTLTVGLYDDVRYIAFASLAPETFEAYVRGELDGYGLWQATTWSVWDEWIERWVAFETWSFAGQDFAAKRFGY